MEDDHCLHGQQRNDQERQAGGDAVTSLAKREADMRAKTLLVALSTLLVTGGYVASGNAEDTLVIKARPLIVKRLKPDVEVVRTNRKSDPQPLATLATARPRRTLDDSARDAAATSTSSEGMAGVTEEDLLAAPPPSGPEPAAHEVRRVDKHAARIPATVVVTRDYGYRQRVRRYRVPIVLRDRGCRASHQHHGHHRHHGHRYACSHGGQAYVGHAHHSHHFHGNFVLGFYFRF